MKIKIYLIISVAFCVDNSTDCSIFSFEHPRFNKSRQLGDPIRSCLLAVDHCSPYEELTAAINISRREYNCLKEKCKTETDYVEKEDVIYKNMYCQNCSLFSIQSVVSGLGGRGTYRRKIVISRGFIPRLVNFRNTGNWWREVDPQMSPSSIYIPDGSRSTGSLAGTWSNHSVNTSSNFSDTNLSVPVVIFVQYDATVAAVTLAGCVTTVVACLILFITYILFKEKRTIPGLCIMSYVFALAAAYILVVTGIDQVAHWQLCTALGVSLHFFFLAHFVWSSVISYDLIRRFASIRSALQASTTNGKNRYQLFISYSLVGWGIPLIVCTITVLLDLVSSLHVDYASDSMCWIQPEAALFYSVIIPICLLLSFNFVSFVVIIVSIHRTMKISSTTSNGQRFGRLRKEAWVFAGVFSLLSLQWMFGVLAAWEEIEWMWYPLIAATPLQGIILVCIYVLNRKTRDQYRYLFGLIRSASCCQVKTVETTSMRQINVEQRTRIDS